MLRSDWGESTNRRRAAHAQEPPGLRCREPAVARQPMGFSRDKALERVRAESAVAPPDRAMARLAKRRSRRIRPSPARRPGISCM